MFEYDKTFWNELETRMGSNFPEVIKHVLRASGFENVLVLRDITEDDIAIIERFVNDNCAKWWKKYRKVEKDYSASRDFCFLPGHKKILFEMAKFLRNNPSHAKNCDESVNQEDDRPGHRNNDDIASTDNLPIIRERMAEYSVIMKQLIDSAEKNHNIPSQGRRYGEILKYFCTYVYMLAGKFAYENLYANLSVPAYSSIGNT